MTPKQLTAARIKLGKMLDLGRDMHLSELGRALRLSGRDPGQTIRKWEQRDGPTGPASVAIEMMLAGAEPPDGWPAVLRGDGK